MNTARRLAPALILAFGVAALADLDAQIFNGNLVTGSLATASTTETFRVVCPAGAALTVTVKGVKKKGATTPAPTFVVRSPTFVPIGADRTVPNATGATAKAIPLDASGTYRIAVSAGAGAVGDFQIAATWKSPAAPPVSGQLAGADVAFDFSADAGAVATFDVSQAPKSAALPRLASCSGPSFAKTFTAPAAGAKRHRATGVVLPATGDYVLHVTDAGGGGLFRGKITLKAPRAVKSKIVLTDAVLGAATDKFANVTTIGHDGGTVGTGQGGDSPIDGASVLVPKGALPSPTSIVVGSGTPIAPQSGQSAAVGQTVVFGPEGLKFAQAVTLTLPFDPTPFGDGGFSGLVVFTRDANGKIAKVTSPLTIDPIAKTVSFQSSHFSSYRAFGPKAPVPGDLNGDGFADLVLPAPGAAESQGRVDVYFGRADFLDNPPTAPDATFHGNFMGETFGAAVAVGDVNGDGQPDLLVGAKSSGPGYVAVFFGGPAFASKSAAAADVLLTGGTSDVGFGTSIVVADVTGDKKPDVIVAAPQTSSTGSENGAVYVFTGGPSFGPLAADSPGVIVLTGGGDLNHLGHSLAAGDLNGDGTADIAAGNDDLSEGQAGIVHVFFGGDGLASQTAGVGTADFGGAAKFDHFGDAIAIGDFNQDGFDDLAVGAPFQDGALAVETDIGRVHVFYGGPAFAGRSADQASLSFGPGSNPTDLFGSSLAAGNVTGNATPDLLATAPNYDGSVGDEGNLYVILGGPTFVSQIDGYAAYAPGDQVGVLFQPVDLDGDGRAEAIVGSPVHGEGAGLVDVQFGPRLFSGRHVVFTGAPGERLGGRN